MRALLLCALCVLLAACTPDWPTITPEPDWTPTPMTMETATQTATPSVTPTATRILPTVTPKPWPTCPPMPLADLTILTCIDANRDGLCTPGDEAPISTTVMLTYQGLVAAGQPYKKIESVSTGERGLWGGPVQPGVTLLHVMDFVVPEGADHQIAPPYDYPGVLALSQDDVVIVSIGFNDFRPTPAPHTPTPTPALVRTATVTPTPNMTPHGCAVVNCIPKDTGCGAKPVDVAGSCAPGFVCCAP